MSGARMGEVRDPEGVQIHVGHPERALLVGPVGLVMPSGALGGVLKSHALLDQTVPNLVGQAARAVEIELKQGGFVPGDEARIASAAVPTGAVISQVPGPDTPAVPASRVHRLVSTGAEIPVWVMPDLIGLDRAGAEAWLSKNGFRRGAVRRISMSGRRSGRVVGQLPLPGYPVRSNDVVDLTIAQ